MNKLIYCPNCQKKVSFIKTNFGPLLMCDSCYGHYYSERKLEGLLGSKQWQSILNTSKIIKREKNIICLNCNKDMMTIKLSQEYDSIEIDICKACNLLWFDKDEIESFQVNNTISAVINENINVLLSTAKLDYLYKQSQIQSKANANAFNFSVSIGQAFANLDIFGLLKIFKKE